MPDMTGIYIHIPFCLKKCRYCDFCSFPDVQGADAAAYVSRLVQEIRSYRRSTPIAVDSIFFGGGTPSLLPSKMFGSIMEALHASFQITSDAEITVEANPKTLTAEKVRTYVASGVNRMSIGLQSINENEQKILGRIHNSKDFFDSMELVYAAGVKNVNVDIMYGIPDQTQHSFEKTVDAVLSVHPSHVSAYSLILEPGTPLFAEKDTLQLPNEDTELSMLSMLRERLASEKIFRYEISNYGVKGAECRHNMKYWTMQPYIGVGVAAHSFFEGARYANAADLSLYIKGEGREAAPLTKTDAMYEYVMLHLRTVRGFSLSQYRQRFGMDFAESRREKLSSLMQAGYLCIQNDRLFLTEKGLYVSNSILTEIL